MRNVLQRVSAFVIRHRTPLVRGIPLALLLVVVLQNVEPTDIDFLFWSLHDIPKLVVILTAMVLGAFLWELARRLWLPDR